MAGIKPFFVTGDKLKILLDGKTIAFATDLSCSIQILHQAPHVLGMYEGVSVEPLSYNISGTFSIIRYVKNAIGNIGAAPPGTSPLDVGNSAATWGSGGFGNVLSTLGGTQGRAFEALNPATYSQGTTFDIEVYQKFAQSSNGSTDNLIGVIKIRSARITKADFSISKKAAGMDRFEFVALYVDGDVSQAQSSGTGQQNT
jgi:hypothetical protein